MRKIKKTLLLAIFSILSICAQAQVEGWYKYPIYNDSISDILVASNKVYYLSGENLYSFSEDDQDFRAYSSLNKLTGNKIASIHYNPEKKYSLLVYDDCNMDVLYDNGKLVNLPEIRDAQLNVDKGVNDVAFGQDRIVIATTFGIVVYDDKKMEVKESGIYNLNVETVAIDGDKLVTFFKYDDGWMLRYAPLNERHNTPDKFTSIGTGDFNKKIIPLGNDKYLMVSKTDNSLYTRTFNYANNTTTLRQDLNIIASKPFHASKEGYYTYDADNLIIVENGEVKQVPLPSQLKDHVVGFYDDHAVVWAGKTDGIAKYDISSATPTVLYDNMLYENAVTCKLPGHMIFSADGQRLYISNMAASKFRSYAKGEWKDTYQTTNVIEHGFVKDVSLKNASATFDRSKNYQKAHNNKRMYGDPAWLVEDPDDPTIYYCSNLHEGLYVIKYNEQTGEYEELVKFTKENMPITETWGYRCQDVKIDPQGNLWVGHWENCHYSILPAAKRKGDLTKVTIDDWKGVTKLKEFDTLDDRDMQSLFCKKSNMVFFSTGRWGSGIIALDTKGTYDNPNDDVAYQWTQFTDQDGITFTPGDYTTFLLEDDRGCVWVGTSLGLYEITNPKNATNPSMTVRRIKVPRNDGTNYADYLLDSDQINWMALDPAGRKWIATEGSGLFLVSETGDKIIKNFTVDNSPLPTNQINSIECDRNNNTVYLGTVYGLYTFMGDSAPVKEDYSEIYAYPNPVRPEYTGDVNITGLMDNTVVKIADASGHVVFQTRAQGGMATWNVCNSAGSRVKSGVYYVYASTNDGTSGSGAVTKILVIN